MEGTGKSANVYFNHSPRIQGKHAKHLVEKIPLNETGTYIDLGCGTGNAAVFLSKKIGPKGKVIAIDPDAARINEAKINNNGDNITFTAKRLTEIVFEDESIDGVVANTVMHWIPSDEKLKIFEQLSRCMKPGAVFAFNKIVKPSYITSQLLQFYPEKKRQDYENALYMENVDFYKRAAKTYSFEIIENGEEIFEFSFPSDVSYINWLDASSYTSFGENFEKIKHMVDIPRDGKGNLVDRIEIVSYVFRKKYMFNTL